MLHIAVCDDDKAAIESHKNITENALKDCGSIGKIETYITSGNLLYDITEDKLFFDSKLLLCCPIDACPACSRKHTLCFLLS